MITIQATETISRPVPRVFEFMADFESAPRWQSGVVQSTILTPGPISRGTRFSQSLKLGLRTVTSTGEITGYEADRLLEYQTTSSGPIAYQCRVELSPERGDTRVRLAAQMSLGGWWRLLTPLLAWEIGKESRKELATLKRLLEAEAAPAVRADVRTEAGGALP